MVDQYWMLNKSKLFDGYLEQTSLLIILDLII